MSILVTGATGTVGGNIVRQLHAAGHQVRALTRDAAKANFPEGIEVVVGNLTQPETLKSALVGGTGLHLINFDGGTLSPLETGSEIMAMAEKAGVQRVTLLRGGQNEAFENAVKASSLAWTVLQPGEFMSNMLKWVEPIQNEGIVREPFGNRMTTIVHPADIAAVAAVALTEEGHGGQEYSITGPEVLSPIKMVGLIAAAIGRDIQFIELTPEQAAEKWRAEGLPQQVIDFLLWVYGNTPEEGYKVLPTVEQVTGKQARTFTQWAAENAHRFRVG